MQKNILSFDELPKAVSQLGIKLDTIQEILTQRIESQSTPIQDKFLSAQEASAFLRITMPTLYSKVSRCELPCMKQGNRLYFSQFELVDYLKTGKRKSNMEILSEADKYLTTSKRGGTL